MSRIRSPIKASPANQIILRLCYNNNHRKVNEQGEAINVPTLYMIGIYGSSFHAKDYLNDIGASYSRGRIWFVDGLQKTFGGIHPDEYVFLKPPANVTRRDKWPNFFYSYATALRSDRVEQFNELLDLFRNYFNSTLKPGTQDPLFALQEEEPYFLSEEEALLLRDWDATDQPIENKKAYLREVNRRVIANLSKEKRDSLKLPKLPPTPLENKLRDKRTIVRRQHSMPTPPAEDVVLIQPNELTIIRFMKIAQEWDFGRPCTYCGCLYLKSFAKRARVFCCRGGKFVYGTNNQETALQMLKAYPDEIKHMLFNDASHFSRSSAIYNRIFAIGATVIDNNRGGRIESIHGEHAVTINGSIRYYLPKKLQSNKGGLSYFTYDGLDRLKAHAQGIVSSQSASALRAHGPRVKELHAVKIFNFLKVQHPMCAELQWIGAQAGSADDTNADEYLTNRFMDADGFNNAKFRATMNGETDFFEVAAFTSDSISSNRQYCFNLKGRSKYLSMNDSGVEALMYPLFYTNNEKGYQYLLRKQLSFHKYMVARIFQPEKLWGYNEFSGHESPRMCFNRFQLLTRQTQHIMVEQYTRALDFRLEWIRKNQNYILGTTFFDETIDVNDIPAPLDDIEESSNSDDEINLEGSLNRQLELRDDDEHEIEDVVDTERQMFSRTSPSFLADSITGSPRHLKALALNAMNVVSQFGAPTFFITLTCNPKWAEIASVLPTGQSAFDRPDLVVVVFRARLKAFLHNLRHGKYFDQGSKVYLMHVIEYQHRGLPHAHIIVRLDNMGETDTEKLDYIDKHIFARHDHNPDDDTHYGTLIKEHMTHKCSSACRLQDGVTCKRGYTERVPTAITSFDDRGFPLYRRPNQHDLEVVPHNREILIDWQGHCNVEFCGRTYAVLYLYKYLFKGNKKQSLMLDNTDDVDKDDEIMLFQRGRMICAMQAMWNMLGYFTYPASEPSVMLIKVKLPQQLNFVTNEGKLCDLSVYFSRPRTTAFNDLTYTSFYRYYDYSRKEGIPNWVKVNYPIYVAGIATFQVFLWKRKEEHLVRMGNVPMQAGEIYYLRLLLSKVPAYSYNQLKTFNEKTFETFQECAGERKLIASKQIATEMFEEALISSNAQQFRSFFVQATLNGHPTVHIFEDEHFQDKLMEDYFHHRHEIKSLATNDMLKELARLFKLQENKELSEYGLPDFQADETELQLEKLKYDQTFQSNLATQLLAKAPLTAEMTELFTYIKVALDTQTTDPSEAHVALLQGRAGAGKTTFAKYVAAYCRSIGKICKGCASTGLAASIYDDFSTAHSLFAIPVIEDGEDYDHEQDIICKLHLPKYKERKALLDNTSLFIWDEVSSQHMKDIVAVITSMKEFKGKVLLFIGDGLQITPVVTHGHKAQICDASIYCSEWFSRIKKFTFSKNLRLQRGDLDPEQIQYIKLLDAISTNRYPSMDPMVTLMEEPIKDGNDCSTKIIAIRGIKRLEGPTSVMSFLFPDGFMPDIMHTSCILATLNDQVDFWNSEVQKLNENPLHELKSHDSLDEVDDPFGYIAAMITEDVMNKYSNNSTAPPHILNLKVGDICILMRAVDKDQKIATNTRVRISQIAKRTVRIATLENPPKTCILPRYLFKLRLPSFKSYVMSRLQFPLRLAFSMSINRSQGQSFNHCVVDLTKEPFSHGHLNVALSRITDPANIAIYASETQYDAANKAIFTSNVVYNEILLALDL